MSTCSIAPSSAESVPGPQPEEQVGRAGAGGDAGVGDDELRPVVAGPPDPARRDRARTRRCWPRSTNTTSARGMSLHGLDARSMPSARLLADAGRHHAEPAVVVEVGACRARGGRTCRSGTTSRCRARRPTAWRTRRCRARPGCGGSRATVRSSAWSQDTGRNPSGSRRVALERIEQAVGVGVLQVALDALGAQLALVERELVPGLEADDLVALHLEDDPALLPAEAAVGPHLAVGVDRRVPAARRCLVEVGAVAGDQLVLGDRVAGPSAEPPDRAGTAPAPRGPTAARAVVLVVARRRRRRRVVEARPGAARPSGRSSAVATANGSPHRAQRCCAPSAPVALVVGHADVAPAAGRCGTASRTGCTSAPGSR